MSGDLEITTWIPETNLDLFLDRASLLIGYRIDELDRDAIGFGVRETAADQDRWYTYPLLGTSSLVLSLAQAERLQRLCLKAQLEAHLAPRLDALVRTMQCYDPSAGTQELEVLVCVAFAGMAWPERNKIVACDAAHLAWCLECQNALAFFQGKHWMDLLRGHVDLPLTYGGLGFLTPEAQRFFFPAYLALAIRDKSKYLLEFALERKKQEAWTPLQHELIEMAGYLPEVRYGSVPNTRREQR